VRRRVLAAVIGLAIMLIACEKPDASHTTSPSARALLGTTTGAAVYGLPEHAPQPTGAAQPPGWDLRFELAVFADLEDGTEALRVVTQTQSQQAAAGMELWLSNQGGTVARWSGGSVGKYDGVVCFQLRLEDAAGESLALPGGDYTATIVFRDVETGPIVTRSIKVTGQVPKLTGTAPGPDSLVFRDLLGCPRGS
jgi:hypothetical protein